MGKAQDCVGAFIDAACVPLDAGHASGTLDDARAILAPDPGLAGRSIHAAAILADDIRVRGWFEKDVGLATSKGGPRGWDALTYLCFSRYLRLDEGRSEAFVRAATALLDAEADPNSGWYENNHRPEPEWESALYGAAGVAHHEGLTRLLLARGADPNDGETPYHAPESYEMGVLKALVDSTALHVASWKARHDTVRLLIDRGATIDAVDGMGRTPLLLAVKACVDSYWTHRRAADSVAALLPAGASVRGVPYPSGFSEVDALLESHGASRT
jgi:ankyrin repeat protein